MANRTGRLSGNDYLYVIERFAVRVAKSIVGGEMTEPNNPFGDLYHQKENAFSEVKGSGLSSGPIVEVNQLERHLDDIERHDHQYVFVLYRNRRWEHGRWVYLPRRAGRTQKALEKFLTLNVREVYILHISVVEAIFRNCPEKDIKCYLMQRGPKTYIKLYPGKMKKLVRRHGALADFGLEPDDYAIESGRRAAKFNGQSIQVAVSTIKPKQLSEEAFWAASVPAVFGPASVS